MVFNCSDFRKTDNSDPKPLIFNALKNEPDVPREAYGCDLSKNIIKLKSDESGMIYRKSMIEVGVIRK